MKRTPPAHKVNSSTHPWLKPAQTRQPERAEHVDMLDAERQYDDVVAKQSIFGGRRNTRPNGQPLDTEE